MSADFHTTTGSEFSLLEAYGPQPKQAEFHLSAARYPLMEGGRGGGKSTALLWEAVYQCLTVPGCNCLLLRRTLTAMEKGGIEDMFTKQVPRAYYRAYNASKTSSRFTMDRSCSSVTSKQIPISCSIKAQSSCSSDGKS